MHDYVIVLRLPLELVNSLPYSISFRLVVPRAQSDTEQSVVASGDVPSGGAFDVALTPSAPMRLSIKV
jgi:hypothetical protein